MNTPLFCESLYKNLKQRDNVEFIFNGCVTGYSLEDDGRKVNKVKINFEKDVPADLVVLCAGPQARTHLREHFGVVLPMISAQGYIVDLPDIPEELDTSCHLKVGDKGYAYAQMSPGKHRFVALMDFGMHDKPFVDPERVKYLRKTYL